MKAVLFEIKYKIRQLFARFAWKPKSPKRKNVDMSAFYKVQPCRWTEIDAVLEDTVMIGLMDHTRTRSDDKDIETDRVISRIARGRVKSRTCPVNNGIGVSLLLDQIREDFNG